MDADHEQQQEHQAEVAADAGAGLGRSRRDPGGPRGALLAWLAIFGMVALIMLSPVVAMVFPEWFEAPTDGPVVIEHSPPGGLMRLTSKYALGATEFFAGQSDNEQKLRVEMMKQVDAFSTVSQSDALRAAIVASALLGADAGIERLDALDEIDEEAVVLPPELIEAKAIVRRALTKGSSTLDEEQRETIVQSEGWYGELLLVADQPEESDERKSLYQGAHAVVALIIGVVVLALIAGVVGLGLLITAGVLYSKGTIRAAYAAPAPGGSVFLETFAIFLVWVFLLFFGAGVVYDAIGVDLSAYMRWLVLPVLFWPLLRGVDLSSWKHAMGWHRGRGILNEVGAGVLGYLAGLPIFAFGIGLTLFLLFVVGVITSYFGIDPGGPMSHPVVDQVGSGGVFSVVMIYVVAVVWAPLFEELFFRGAMYHHMRGLRGAVASSLVVAFVFAAIHPQGIIAIPALMGLAVVFALIREWRGSIIGPMVAHGMHNAMIVTVTQLALS